MSMAEKLFFALLASSAAIVYIVLQALDPYPAFYHSRLVHFFLQPIFFLLCAYRLRVWWFRKKINPLNKAVLITGCDSGFGNRLAKRLDSRGFHVFASCLFPEGNGANDLKQTCSNRLKVLPLDVSSDESVAGALEFVKKNLGSHDFWGVVNNAGLSKGSAVDLSTIQHFKHTIDVNAMGTVRVTKAFLPLLKKSKGRVVNVASVLGRIPMSHLCPYVMSKHAVVAFSGCLSLEMMPWGVRVISIEPDTYRTPITDFESNTKRMRAELEEIDESIVSSYGEEYFEQLEKLVRPVAGFSSSNIDIVVDAMESALTEEHPHHVYKPRWSWHSKVMCSICETVPFSVMEKGYFVGATLLRYPVPSGAKKNVTKTDN